MPRKKSAPLRTELRDGSRIERNYRTGDDGEPVPYGSWYWVAYDPDKKPARKRVNLRTKDHAAAMTKAAERALDYDRGTFNPWTQSAPRSGVAFKEAATRFLDAQRAAGKSPATVEWDQALLKRFETSLPVGVLLGHIDRRMVEAFVNARKPVPKSKADTQRLGDERSPSTKSRIMATLRHFTTWSVTAGLIRVDPTAGITVAGTGPVHRRDHITPDEERAILAAIAKSEDGAAGCRDWIRDWIVFGTHTGLRPKEQKDLCWDAVRLGERKVSIGLRHGVKTPKSRRVVSVEGPALEVLRRRWEAREDGGHGPVFTGQGGEPVNTLYLGKALKRYAAVAGVSKNVVPYSLRHAFGTRTAMAGIPLFSIAKEMGTSVAMVEKHYAHYAPESMAGQLRALYAGSPSPDR